MPVTRRHFLRTSALLSSALATARTVADEAATDRPPNGFGFSLYGMRSLAIDDALERCAEIGYDCVELPVQAGWPGDSQRISESAQDRIAMTLKSTGLRLTAFMEHLPILGSNDQHRKNLDRLASSMTLARKLSPTRTPVIETILGGKPAAWEQSKDAMAAKLEDWADVAERHRVVIAIKAHVGGAMHRPEHPVRLAGQVDSPFIRCAYDFSHFGLRGIDMAESIRTLVPHSSFIHIKDYTGDASKVRFLLPGDGDTDYVKYLRLIREANYGGDIVVEVSGQIHGRPGYQPVEAARRCYKNLAPAFAKAGVVRG